MFSTRLKQVAKRRTAQQGPGIREVSQATGAIIPGKATHSHFHGPQVRGIQTEVPERLVRRKPKQPVERGQLPSYRQRVGYSEHGAGMTLTCILGRYR